MDAVAPPYTNPGPTHAQNPTESHNYLFLLGFFCTVILVIIITYVSCSCKHFRSPPPPVTVTVTYDDRYNNNLIRIFPRGVDDDIHVTFPTFVYSDKFGVGATGSGCSICLEDYKPPDVIRLLPECGHMFHVRCIDTWLKAHRTCPMCRNFACTNLTELT